MVNSFPPFITSTVQNKGKNVQYDVQNKGKSLKL
jgi:hypothetical protein